MANAVVLGITMVLIAPQLPLPLAAGALAGATAGLILTPDIDHHVRTHEELRMYRHLGIVGGGLWELFWRGYARTHVHRGYSHKPFTGTLGRWWYAFKRLWWLLLILLIYQGAFILSHAVACFAFVYMAYCFHALQDIVHLVLDGWRYHTRG